MSDHDFEKQVQQKMEQLRLRPSDAVWTKVDTRIRKERRRRRVVLWLPLFLLCVVAGGYFFYSNSTDNNKFTASELNSTHNNSNQENNSNSASQNGNSVTNTNKAVPPASGTTHNTHAVPGAETAIEPAAPTVLATEPPAGAGKITENKPANNNTNTSSTGNSSAPLTISHSVQPKAAVVPKSGYNKSSNGNNRKPVTKNSVQSAVKAPEQPAADQLAVKEPVKADPVSTDSALLVANDTDQRVTTESDNTEPQPNSIDSGATVPVMVKKTAPKKKPAVIPTPETKKKNSSWSFGIIAEGGASHISKGSPFSLLSKKNNEPEDLAMASPVSNNQNFLGNPAGFTQIPEKKPDQLRSGLSWSAGGFVQKQLTNRLSLSAGVQYSYFSMTTNVGEFVNAAIAVTNANYDQIVSEYYQGRSAYVIGGGLSTTTYPRPPQEHEYTNKYHFLEFPVKIHWRINHDEAAFPLIVDGGLSVAKLIASNALHYDGANNVYYKDYDYFNKLQAGITAGINVALFNESKHPVWIGPTIKYQLSNLLTSDLSSGQHLWSFGLGAKFFLKK